MANLPLTPVADVTYSISAPSAPRRGFNLGLIVGTSDVIDPEDRVVVYSSLTEMIDDGFSLSSPEYLAAVKYFASPSSPSQVAIGVQASGETAVAALTACRSANSEWYDCYIAHADNVDHEDIADYIEAVTPYSRYFFQSSDAAILSDPNNNIFHTMKLAEYRRTIGLYATTAHAVASIMGYGMGAMNDLPNSVFTYKFKAMPGVTPDDLTTQQVNNVEGNYGNVCVRRSVIYTWFENGNAFDGSWMDETINLDKLANDIQLNVTDLLVQSKSIPQTEAGVNSIKNVIDLACQLAVSRGFIAPGQWNGSNILTLKTGQMLPTGYMILSQPINTQGQADRDARKAPPIYVAIKLAGSVHSVVIGIEVNR